MHSSSTVSFGFISLTCQSNIGQKMTFFILSNPSPEAMTVWRLYGLDLYIDNLGFNSLHKAITGLVYADIVSLIRVDPKLAFQEDVFGNTPLHWEAMRSNLEAIDHLLDAGADIDAISSITTSTPLSMAAALKIVDSCRHLLKRGKN